MTTPSGDPEPEKRTVCPALTKSLTVIFFVAPADESTIGTTSEALSSVAAVRAVYWLTRGMALGDLTTDGQDRSACQRERVDDAFENGSNRKRHTRGG